MSGTSMDGIDAALLYTDGEESIQEIDNLKSVYNKDTQCLLKAAERAICKSHGDLSLARSDFLRELHLYLQLEQKIEPSLISKKIDSLTTYIEEQTNSNESLSLDSVIQHSTLLHVKIIDSLLIKCKKSPSEIDVIGYHGQTMYHNAKARISLQIGDGRLLAKKTGIRVVNDFRSRDLEFGGQGAPFAPIYHQALARRDKKIPLVVVNCGGISNLSIISNTNIESLIGFDAGPGNGLVDAFVRQRTNGSKTMDFNGKYGLNGQVDQLVLEKLFTSSIVIAGVNYFLQDIPKSLDIRDMQLIAELDNLSIEDGCRTLEVFTADMIVKSLDLVTQNHQGIFRNWVLAGGGFHNPVIKDRLISRLRQKYGEDVSVVSADEAAWNNDAMEAQIFAYLAVRSLKGMPLSVPGTTNVSKAVSGGVVYNP
ncbi:MAG: anhydro-N-acetylmuramic acid kinase [Legionellaceae bacterium]|nr:anhydro-N-acetylmuramic acid kinase [Legionellaceae bacterium]